MVYLSVVIELPQQHLQIPNLPYSRSMPEILGCASGLLLGAVQVIMLYTSVRTTSLGH